MQYTAQALLFFLLQLMLAGCQMPPAPPEVSQAKSWEQTLRKGGGEFYAEAELQTFSQDLRKARAALRKEQRRFAWLVDYGPVQREFAELCARGGKIREKIESEKTKRKDTVSIILSGQEKKVATLATLARSINEGRVARKALTQVEVLHAEARGLLAKEKFEEAMARLGAGELQLEQAEEALRQVAGRYADPKQIESWKRLVEQARKDSRKEREISILVNKLDRTLIVLQGGAEIRQYDIGLGRNGLHDKFKAGDQATPEGRYRVVKKVPDSRFYRALLLNYPNEDDRKEFAAAKKSGRIPKTASIGGLVEVHGGGKDGMTDGCVSLENNDMAELFKMAKIGTRVTIVGSVQHENIVSSTLE